MANVFALRGSRLNAFLYADVGTVNNGCGVTILSVLARLGKDPWAEAVRWSNTPKDAVIDALTQNIDEMHLRQHADGTAHSTALHLTGLLPAGLHTPDARPTSLAATSVIPGGMMTVISWALLYLALSIGMSRGPWPHASTAATPAPTAALVSKPAVPLK